jgi:hypothetical protein
MKTPKVKEEPKDKATRRYKCSCLSPFQDERCGKGVRIWNKLGKLIVGNVHYRCTVCGATRIK